MGVSIVLMGARAAPGMTWLFATFVDWTRAARNNIQPARAGLKPSGPGFQDASAVRFSEQITVQRVPITVVGFAVTGLPAARLGKAHIAPYDTA